jgi:SH3 domain protein
VKNHSVLFLFILVSSPGYAKTIYVTDSLDLPLRSEESSKGKIISLLHTGTPLVLLSENNQSGFSKVQLQNGMQGFISTRNTMSKPPNHSKLESTTKDLTTLQVENTALKEELAKTKATITPGTTLEQSLSAERDRLDRELLELKRISANQIQVKNERDELKEQLVKATRDFEQLKLESKAMKDGANQDWFLYGGMLSLAGVILGFILPKMAWRRKNSWDNL